MKSQLKLTGKNWKGLNRDKSVRFNLGKKETVELSQFDTGVPCPERQETYSSDFKSEEESAKGSPPAKKLRLRK
jgi:hypothetical protein